MYLTFAEYLAMGGALDETTFNDLEFEAATQVDWYTFSRLKKMPEEEQPDELKRCMYKLIQLLQARDGVSGVETPATSSNAGSSGTIASQSNDGVSISYNRLSAQGIVDNTKTQIQSTINQYLANVVDSLGRKVLYRGVYPNE